MREIKFRGKSTVEVFDGGDTPDINLGDWIYGSLIIDNGEAFIVNGVVECTSEYISIEKWCPVDIKTVGQLTGLKDKNGTEIYEGDRLEYQPNINEDFATDRYTVKWHNRGFVAAWDGDKDCNNSDNDGLIGGPKLVDMVVIGNIYENPELLEEVGR